MTYKNSNHEKAFTLINSINHIGKWIYSPASNYIFWSEEMYSILHIPKNISLLDNSLVNLFSGEYKKLFETSWKFLLEEGIPYDLEIPFITPNNVELWLRLIGTSFVDEGEKIFCGSIQEIAKYKLKQVVLEHLLDNAKKVATDVGSIKTQFLANISHEIRTPMNSILGMAEMLSETNLSLEQRRYVQIFKRAGEDLLSIINTILDLSRIENNKLTLDSVEFSLRDFIEEIADFMAFGAHQKSLEFILSISPEIHHTVHGDYIKLRQILANIIGNAIKFTEKGDILFRVELVSKEPYTVKFAISDTGQGISKEKQHLLFKDFTQIDQSMTRKYGGTGMGLSISQRLAQLMNTCIVLENDVSNTSKIDDGKDDNSTSRTTFSFSLTFDSAKELINPFSEKIFDGKYILLIEPNKTYREVISSNLRYFGANVKLAENALDALNILSEVKSEKKDFSTIFVNDFFPDLPIITFFNRLLSFYKESSLPDLCVMLHKQAKFSMQELVQYNVSHCISKPLKIQDLLLVSQSNSRHNEKAQKKEDEAKRPNHALKILLAEDSPDNRTLIKFFLSKTQHTLDIAENGYEAVELCKKNTYDLILMDIQMPIMDGYTAVKKIRSWEDENAHSKTPIVALTAHAFLEDEKKSITAGFSMHLTKPIKKQLFLSIVESYSEALNKNPSEKNINKEIDGNHSNNVIIDNNINNETATKIQSQIKALIPDYLENRRSDILLISNAMLKYEWDKIAQIAHLWKGSGSMFGLDEISNYGKELELLITKGKAENFEDTTFLIENINKILISLEGFLLCKVEDFSS